MPENIKIKAEFWEMVCGVAEELSKEDDLLVVSHHDADGMTACAVMVELLTSLGKKTEFMILKQLDSTTISQVKEKGAGKTVVFTDMGSGQLSMIRNNNIEKFYIIDHHQPEGEYEKQVNPHFHGYDGGFEISASGLTYFVAKALGNMKMAHVALVGAVGDMQDSRGKLYSLNRIILADGERLGLLKVKQDIRLFGRQSRPLTQMLAYASDPMLPGLTGNEAECATFLKELDIELQGSSGWKSYVDLTFDERRRLSSALYMRLLDFNIPEFVIQGMIGEVYTLLGEMKHTELRDAKEYASLLNACGRQGKPEVGVQVCLGDRGENWENARDILQIHRRELREGIQYLKDNGVNKELDNIYYFDSEGAIKESIIGVIAGMGYGAGAIPADRPVLAFADDRDDEKMLKVSGRANWGLVRAGVHLGAALREITPLYGGEGGGHNIAAGARILKDKKDGFLSAFDKRIGEQLKR